MKSGKRYRVDTKKRSRGQYIKLFIETNYSPLLSESEGEGNPPKNPEITLQCSPFQHEIALKLEPSEIQTNFGFPHPFPPKKNDGR